VGGFGGGGFGGGCGPGGCNVNVGGNQGFPQQGDRGLPIAQGGTPPGTFPGNTTTPNPNPVPGATAHNGGSGGGSNEQGRPVVEQTSAQINAVPKFSIQENLKANTNGNPAFTLLVNKGAETLPNGNTRNLSNKGLGVLVGRKGDECIILTAAHVASAPIYPSQSGPIKFSTPDFGPVEGTAILHPDYVKKNEEAKAEAIKNKTGMPLVHPDIALIKFKSPKCAEATQVREMGIAARDPKQNEPVYWSSANFAGLFHGVATGYNPRGALNVQNNDQRLLRINAGVAGGDSGGPLYNQNYEVVGVTTSVLANGVYPMNGPKTQAEAQARFSSQAFVTAAAGMNWVKQVRRQMGFDIPPVLSMNSSITR